ncbi:MAG: ATP-binding protein [Desulfomonilaceae bacterium]
MRINSEAHSKYALMSCFIVLGIVTVVALGWILGKLQIAGFGPKFIPMAPLTAVLFCLLSLVISLQVANNTAGFRLPLGILFLAISAILCVLDLADFLLGDPFDFEAILIRNPKPFGQVLSGRISPIASACFLLATVAVGLSIYSNENRKSLLIEASSILGAVLIFANIVFILGYIYGAPLLYGGRIIPVGLSTAIAFIFLGGSIILMNGPGPVPLSLFTGNSTRSILLRAFVPVSVLLVIGSNIFMVYAKSYLKIQHALLSAISTLVAMLVTGTIIFKIAQQIGASLDKAENALKESEERFKSIFENSLDGLLFTSPEGQVLQANRAAQIMLGRTEDEIVKMGRDSFVDLTDVRYWTSLETRKMTGKFLGEVNFKRKDGSIFPAEISSVTFDDSQGKGRAITVVRDISERKMAEQEKEDLRTQLLQSQKMQALGTMVDGIAHDFNNMLQIIVGYCEILLIEKNDGDPDHAELQTILKIAQEEAELVKRLITFVGKGPVQKVPVFLNDRIKDLVSILSHSFPRDIEIKLDLAEGLSCIEADPGQIDQVLINLAINSREAMPDGGTLELRTRNLYLDEDCCKTNPTMKPGNYVMLSVCDTGRGMGEETLTRVFEPFFSTKQRDSTRGTGLGLSVVRGIVEKHGGSVSCESQVGAGTKFTVLLPSAPSLT